MNRYYRMEQQPQYTRTPRPVVRRKPRYTLHHVALMRRARTSMPTPLVYGKNLAYTEIVWWWLRYHQSASPNPRCLFRREYERLSRALADWRKGE